MEWLASLARIKTLKLVPNPFRDPPEAVAKGGIESIERYYKNIFAQGFIIERRHVKVVIIGKAGAGKTRCAIVSRAGRRHRDDVQLSYAEFASFIVALPLVGVKAIYSCTPSCVIACYMLRSLLDSFRCISSGTPVHTICKCWVFGSMRRIVSSVIQLSR